MAHCKLHCGFCQGPATPPEPCINRISNCVEYGTKICTSVSLTQWTKHNCPKYCGFCGGGPIPTDPTTLQTTPAPTRASVCRNEINNCEEYGGKDMCHQPAYEAWAKSHCAEFCEYCSNYKHYKGQTLSNNITCPDWNLPIECKLEQTNGACCPMPDCPQGYKLYAKLPLYASGGPIPTDPITLQTTPAPTRASVCRNEINNCEEYGGKDMCHQPAYEAWAKSHCAEFCEYCSNYKHYKGQTLSNNVTCPDWNLPIECKLKQTNGACCPMPECLQGYTLYAKSPFES